MHKICHRFWLTKIRVCQAFPIVSKRMAVTSEQRSDYIHSSKTRIGTHDGTFHCDEVLACFLLKILPEYKNSDIIRTREENKLQSCDIVVDVGGTYDPFVHRYDHHQRSFNESMNTLNSDYPWTTKLSSAGLVYFHFGHRILSQILNMDPNDSKIKVIFRKVYENFLEEIDGIDNGISACCSTPRYTISTNLSSRVKMLNPKWNSVSPDFEVSFYKAIKLVEEEFMDRVLYYSNTWWPARELVGKALKERHNVYSSGEIVHLSEGSCPWKDHLLCLEKEQGITSSIKFVIYEDAIGNHRVQCVPVNAESFENRLSLCEEWRGLRNDELSRVSGIPGCIFVHSSGFIGGNLSRDGALQMAINTLKQK